MASELRANKLFAADGESSPLVPTPDEGDVSQKVVNTEFVKNALITSSGIGTYVFGYGIDVAYNEEVTNLQPAGIAGGTVIYDNLTTLPGTWKCLGVIVGTGATLFQRII